jgi:hypothetical protein
MNKEITSSGSLKLKTDSLSQNLLNYLPTETPMLVLTGHATWLRSKLETPLENYSSHQI